MSYTEDETDPTTDAIDSLHGVMLEIKELLSKLYQAKNFELSQKYMERWSERK